MNAESFMRIERSPRRFRKLRDEFKVAQRRHDSDDEGNKKRQPNDTADLLRDLPRERIYAGAENIADDEEKQQPGSHDPV